MGDCGVGEVALSVDPSALADAAVGLDVFVEAGAWGDLLQPAAVAARPSAAMQAIIRVIVWRSP
jgi:hypothetical protein